MAEPALTILDLCRIVAAAEMRPFGKTDYYGYAGVSRDGPHEIADVGEWTVVRDGDCVELSREDEDYMGAPVTYQLRMDVS